MLGREFVKRIRLLMGRTETVKTRFDLNENGVLTEHVVLETHDKLSGTVRQETEAPHGPSNLSKHP
jgi:hypothetical protein